MDERLIRLANIDRILKSGPKTYKAIAKQLNVSTRTIYKDFRFLEDFLGAPIDLAGPQSHSGWKYTTEWDFWGELRNFVEEQMSKGQ